ncbi:MFS transporter [Olivibacter sitiensis]|uniref:MFS transporter n=1 Tax=Olivibacter sitiensis TaxID=376470 RepID=UPI00041CAD04|nr:MFS transporter [Olivibacter sitiensis]
MSTQTVKSATVYPIIVAISLSHLLNDTIQSLIPAIYPLVKDSFGINFAQVGLITLVFQLSSSLLQPLVGFYTDKKLFPFALPTGMTFSLIGLLGLAFAPTYPLILVSVAFVGIGSSIFHPEASRMAHTAAGGKRGLAQSLFQVGGNIGSAMGPLLAALIISPFGRSYISWFSFIALLAILILYKISRWYKPKALRIHVSKRRGYEQVTASGFSRSTIVYSSIILLVLIFSKYFYTASISSYFTFYLMDKFGLNVQQAQMHLFIFLVSVSAGALIGGPIGDRYGRKFVIWGSILGVAPFTLLMPYANLFWTSVLSVIIGLIISSAFSAILVYAQELMPGRIGVVSGFFYGFAFGMGGIGSALLGKLADQQGIDYVYHLCSFLPLLGIVAIFLPNQQRKTV